MVLDVQPLHVSAASVENAEPSLLVLVKTRIGVVKQLVLVGAAAGVLPVSSRLIDAVNAPSVRSAQLLAIDVRSKSTYGTLACVKREAGLPVASLSQAFHVPPSVLVFAALWHCMSAPVSPLSAPVKVPLLTKTRRTAWQLSDALQTHAPLEASQASTVHTLASLQVLAVPPLHAPDWQVLLLLHGSPP
jgi:hypothetical protein